MERGSSSGGYGRGRGGGGGGRGGYARGRAGGNGRGRGGGTGRGFDCQQHSNGSGAGVGYQQRRDHHDNQQLGSTSGAYGQNQYNRRGEQQNQQRSSSWRQTGGLTEVDADRGQVETVPSSIGSGSSSIAGGVSGARKFPGKEWKPAAPAPVQRRTPSTGMNLLFLQLN